MNPRALEGVRVLDLSRILAGPTAGQLLGDFGAEVIKVERRGQGDDARRLGGENLRATDGTESDFAPMYVCANRNKKSMCVDITKPEGADILRRLAQWADVLIENYKVGDLKRYGLDYESLSTLYPRLVYCSITGFGQTGPYAPRAGFDSVFQALSGLMSTTGYADTAPGGGPMRVGVPIIDFIGGLYAFSAIMVALHHRDRASGSGQHIDLSLLDAGISATTIAMANFFATGRRFERLGNEQAAVVPVLVLNCRDGEVFVSAPTDDAFRRLCRALQCPGLADDNRFSSTRERIRNRAALTPELLRLASVRHRDELLRALDANAVPAAPVCEMDQVFADPQVKHRGNDVEIPHPTLGKIRIGTNPIRLSETPVEQYAPPPMLGEHTDWVLTRVLGLSPAEVQALHAAGAVQ